MSDLDADLYGDLYGDDNEFAVPLEDTKDTKPLPQEQEPHEKTETPTTPTVTTKEESPQPFIPPKKEEYTSPIPTLGGNGIINTPQPIQSYSSNTQDYSGRGEQVYRAVPQHDLAQSNSPSLQIMDRHVRPSEMKDEGKMFIGGLNWDTTDEGLKAYFEQFGKVEACTIMRDGSGRSRCFAFLTFEEAASVNAVMVREHYLDGKVIDPKRAIPRQEHQRAQKLFVGGLAGSVTSESMREYFSQYGKVIDSTVMLDRETGRSKGFGFVSFENANVDPLLGFGKLEIDGKMIDVKLAQPRHQRDGGMGDGAGVSPGASAGGGGGNFRSGGFGGQNDGAYGGGGSSGYNAGASAGAAAGGVQPPGSTPFDPQALAQLYTRMFQQFGGAAGMGNAPTMGGMGMMGAGGMGGMSGMGGMGMGMGGAPGMGRMGGGGMMTMGAGPMGPMAGRGGMAGGMMGGGSPMNAPRGPRGAPTGPQGGLGPQRTQRGHGYHPYSR